MTEENANDARVGVVSNVWFNDKDGWYWCDGIIWDKTAQNLITDKGWSVSCSYDVKLADDTGGSENNIPYNIEFLDGVFTHLAIVNNPRYERANIVLNSKTVNMVNNTELEQFTNAFLEAIEDVVKKNTVNNGWVTLDKVDEDGERIKIWIDGSTPGSHDVKWFRDDIAEFKKTKQMKVDLKGIPNDLTKTITSTIDEIKGKYKIKDFVSVSSETLHSAYAFNITEGTANAIRVSKKLFKDSERIKQSFTKDCDALFHPVGLKNVDPTKAIIMHELGHSITVAGENKEFWSEIKTIQNAHNKDLGASTYKKFKEDKDKLNLTNFISAYALYNKYEFVAEAFADAMLSKNPCKYSQDVLKCIDKHFKLSTKDIKQLRLFNALKEVLNMDKQTIINKKGDTQSEQSWVENYGLGYPTQEGFEKWLETQDEQED